MSLSELPKHLLSPELPKTMIPSEPLPVLEDPGNTVVLRLPKPKPKPKPETSYLLLGLQMDTTHPDGDLGDPYYDRMGMFQDDILGMPVGHYTDPSAAVVAAYALFGEDGVDQVQVRPLTNGKADGHKSWWLSEDKDSYKDRSARDGVTRPVFGKGFVTIDDALDGGVDLLTLMKEDE
jgi:hypothetical protein